MSVGFLIGNTCLRWARLDDVARLESASMSWERFDADPSPIQSFVRNCEADVDVVVGSVRDDLLTRLLEALPASMRAPSVARRDFALPIDNRYETPEDVGVDRLLNAIAARERFTGEAIIIVDFGTALSLSVVSPEGAFVGGAIGVGARTALEALWRETPSLPPVEPRATENAVERSTEQALASGLFRQFVGGVRGLVADLRAEVGSDAHVVATGGEAEVYSPAIPEIELVDRDLAMRGLAFAARTRGS
jgi:type III pantothenate kinase